MAIFEGSASIPLNDIQSENKTKKLIKLATLYYSHTESSEGVIIFNIPLLLFLVD